MIKFSRAGWNNIIIFAVMAFILLINATHDNVFYSKNKDESEHYLFGAHAQIVTLTINQQIVIERIGKSWRATSTSLNGQALDQMMLTWQQTIVDKTPAPENVDRQLALVVSAELAGQTTPVTLHLHIINQQFYIYNQLAEQWYLLPLPIYNQLIPEQLFS